MEDEREKDNKRNWNKSSKVITTEIQWQKFLKKFIEKLL